MKRIADQPLRGVPKGMSFTSAMNAQPVAPGFFSYAKSLISRYPLRSAIIFASFLVAGVLEGIGVGALLPLLAALQEPGGAFQGSAIFKQIPESILGTFNIGLGVGAMAALIAGLVFAKAGLQFYAMRQVGYATANMANDLRQQLIQALTQARWSYFATTSTGQVTNSLITETDRAALSYLNLCKLLADGSLVMIYVVIAVLISWPVTVAAFIASVVLMIVLHRLVSMVKQAGREQTTLFQSLAAQVTDALGGFKAIKAMGREEYFRALMIKDTKGLWQAKRKEVLGTELMNVAREPLVVVLMACGFFAAQAYADLSLPELMVFGFMFLRVFQKMTSVQVSYQKVVAQESAYWSVSAAIQRATQSREETREGKIIPALAEKVQFKDVHFAHSRSGAKQAVLKGISCVFPARSFSAIIGPSGSGKTTMQDIILGFYRPDTGDVLFDGVRWDDVNFFRWREHVGYIPQDGFLLHDTILNNVTLGRDMKREEAEEALRRAGIFEFVQGLPQGIDTVAGERGQLFSGGQRQRIALARALAQNPVLLLLDEPTSALDKESETLLLNTLKELSRSVTVIVISHSERVREYADRVYHLDRGLLKEKE